MWAYEKSALNQKCHTKKHIKQTNRKEGNESWLRSGKKEKKKTILYQKRSPDYRGQQGRADWNENLIKALKKIGRTGDEN